MLSKAQILDKLKNTLPELSKYGVNHIGLFGSYSRDEQKDSSDVDLLVDFLPSQESYDNFLSICDIIQNIFPDKHVEIITKNSLSKHIGPYILNEVIYA